MSPSRPSLARLRSQALVLALSAAFTLSGCAAALPALGGGSTTPARRGDLLLGGAARVPFGKLREPALAPTGESRYRRDAQASGVVPVVAARYGLAHHLDLGILVAGTTVRGELRREHVLVEDSTRPSFVYGLAPFVGMVEGGGSEGGRATRFGLDLPVTYAVEIGGLYEVWLGIRAGAEGVRGQLGADGVREDVSAQKVYGGALFGVGLGFRRLHVLLELTAAYEQWWGSHGITSFDRGGFVLTPAFALRFRI